MGNIMAIFLGDGSPLLNIWILGPFVAWGLSLLYERKYKSLSNYLYLLSSYIFIQALFISLELGWSATIASFLSWAAWFGLFMYLTNYEHKLDWFKIIILIFFVQGLLQNASVIYEALSGSFLLKVVSVDYVERRYGISQSVSVAGVKAGLGILSNLFLIKDFKHKSNFIRILLLLLLGSQSIGIVLVLSRGPLIFTIIAILYILYYQNRKQMLTLLGLLMVLVIGGYYIITYAIDEQTVKFISSATSTSDAGNEGRFDVYIKAFKILYDDVWLLLFGHGAGMSAIIPNAFFTESFTNESSFIKVFYELGLVGGGLFLFILILIFSTVFSDRGAIATDRVIYGRAILLMICFELLIHDMIMAWVISFAFWSILGVLIMEIRKEKHYVQR